MSKTLLQGQAAQPIQVGDIVSNFSAVVRVDELHAEYGALVTIILTSYIVRLLAAQEVLP